MAWVIRTYSSLTDELVVEYPIESTYSKAVGHHLGAHRNEVIYLEWDEPQIRTVNYGALPEPPEREHNG